MPIFFSLFSSLAWILSIVVLLVSANLSLLYAAMDEDVHGVKETSYQKLILN